jgi:hypothetical protein
VIGNPRGCFLLPGTFFFLAAIALAAPPPEKPTVFVGMCDASAAAALDENRFVVADDEDNVLRVYSRAGGAALFSFDVSEFLGNQGKKKPKEADLEAAARIGAHTFWITSHGRNSKGKEQPERQRLFATKVRVSGDKVELTPTGKPYLGLLDDLLADKRLARYRLAEAAKLAPKEPGALNIEGLAATPDGHLLIGFRNPVPEGRALIVPLLNPLEVCEGQPAKLGAAMELDLQGLGIRCIDYCAGRYVIIAGATGANGGPSRLFEWDGKAAPRRIDGVALTGLNPEGIAFHQSDGADEYFILSDDGGEKVEGMDCKDLKDPALKRFRGRVLKF